MEKVVQVGLGEFRGIGLYNLKDIVCKRGDIVILSIDRATEYGKIISDTDASPEGRVENLPGKVLRVSTEEDLKRIERNKEKAKETGLTCEKKIAEQNLSMKIIHCEFSFDNSKIVFFFISDERVDFRNLVKELAGIFRARIELKQIGVRDQAKTVGGIGCCGRALCCCSYMRDFHPLTIKMAKEQDLPINPSRISGVCGRIKCCMAYEFPLYKQYAKGMPKRGAKINTPLGKGKVFDVNILQRCVKVDLGEGKTTKVSFGKGDEE
ncbi:MAG: regulatory iron-sulfur-containing complex subunit RicT [Candidatus Omnitrophica bacterium]|nr:regulatory iron-sulfur-containing complex subunit RicT [Candidatus Omnitrophota bacterium]